jgi:hypothetical protein
MIPEQPSYLEEFNIKPYNIMTNAEIRWWYLEVVSGIPALNEKWKEQGLSLPKRAEQSWLIRHGARLAARNLMANPQEVENLRKLDIAKYNNPNGPMFEHCIQKAKNAGLEGDAIYEAIISGSYRTNLGINKKFDL